MTVATPGLMTLANDTGPQGNALGRVLGTHPRLKSAPLVRGHRQRRSWFPHAAIIPHDAHIPQVI